MDIIVTMIIPSKIAPFTLRAVKMAMMNRPRRDIIIVVLPLIEPKPRRVASLLTTIPADCKPMKATKSPIPALMPIFRDFGIAFIMASRMLVSVRTAKIAPSMNTAVRAMCQDTPITPHTLKAKNALSPIPGANAMG